MEEKIKAIVATYIKLPASQIGESTPIGRAVLGSSILLHRMYARLGEEGVVVNDYAEINVFGDLMRKQGVGGVGTAAVGGLGPAAVGDFGPAAVGSLGSAAVGGLGSAGERMGGQGIGIDIEAIEALPRAADLRKEPFYTQNFTPAEIAYCILQADPYASLAGLFTAKEAIVKADGQLRNRAFNTLEIGHSTGGRPEFPGFSLSISHAGGMAVAVAVRGGAGALAMNGDRTAVPAAEPAEKPVSMGWIPWIALMLATAALLVALIK